MRSQTAPGVFQHRYDQPRSDVVYGHGPSLATLTQTEWKQRGSCTGPDGDKWFAEPSTRTSMRAASICHQCPMRELCLAWAIVFGEEFGVWGGLNPIERRPLTRQIVAREPLDRVLSSASTDRGEGA